MEGLPLPESLTCRLSIKNGDPLEACRDKVPPSKFPGQWRPEFDIYLKPNNNAKQKHFEVMCQEDVALLAQLKEVWYRARRRRNGQAGFELEVFVYVPKPEAQTSLRRASAARIQEQMPRVAAFLREHQVEAGPASRRYMAVTQARLPEGTPLAVPDSATFHQRQHVDYRVVRVKLHGVPVPLQVNVGDLCEALGLPNYSLRPPFRPPTNIETPVPATNIADEEHRDPNVESMEQ
ncbi:hypothetical protein PHYSODRAFT_312723 [Phytophthora sojae]|uniref:Uncharacterized protein n=1 Tax=Phytophthora sojae (strain P6497) TaxID=1094619 RepID=G4Z7E7_PHYSP|nr:hypothetical protein PHYSODRAFT_312723 [Phytophthora sojae]EGZ19655.1 hypothetical protein PHYSODRAFT_312723 [Phytophthora sojae]|eukprot:XP_009522372.1 hypothetical protein PHYSODRAFT_312723 [Phytophthora sojae]